MPAYCTLSTAEVESESFQKTKKEHRKIMTAKIILIVVCALTTVGAMIWIGKMADSKDENPDSRKTKKQ